MAKPKGCDARIEVRLPIAEKAGIEEAAQRAGMSVSELVRLTARSGVRSLLRTENER